MKVVGSDGCCWYVIPYIKSEYLWVNWSLRSTWGFGLLVTSWRRSIYLPTPGRLGTKCRKHMQHSFECLGMAWYDLKEFQLKKVSRFGWLYLPSKYKTTTSKKCYQGTWNNKQQKQATSSYSTFSHPTHNLDFLTFTIEKVPFRVLLITSPTSTKHWSSRFMRLGCSPTHPLAHASGNCWRCFRWVGSSIPNHVWHN